MHMNCFWVLNFCFQTHIQNCFGAIEGQGILFFTDKAQSILYIIPFCSNNFSKTCILLGVLLRKTNNLKKPLLYLRVLNLPLNGMTHSDFCYSRKYIAPHNQSLIFDTTSQKKYQRSKVQTISCKITGECNFQMYQLQFHFSKIHWKQNIHR